MSDLDQGGNGQVHRPAPPAQIEGTLDVMVRDPFRLRAEDDRMTVAAHPGWREVHALPVVDAAGAYLGAVRYRTLRAVEGALQTGEVDTTRTADALADLFVTGAAGLLEAVAGARARPGAPGGG
ncbi:MAG: hypothetical protein R3263_12700 [Myxococcota bacterium]|nr:hypothetical protein [Myxococcota bacterium]